MSRRKTSLEVNVELLREAGAILGTGTIRETVERALLEVVRAEARRAEVEALAEMDGLELDDPGVMSGAWSE